MFRKITLVIVLAGLLCTFAHPFGANPALAAGNEDNSDYVKTPPFLTAAAPPLVMLVLARSHKLYYEAYNDASDLNGDGILDVGYKPDEIDYYGYFDSYKCYTYASSLFSPSGATVANTYASTRASTKACDGAGEWSGDFLNYLTMSRMDAIRKVLYGGYRSTDSASDTVLQRAYVPQDAHGWGKEYKDVATNGYDIRDYTSLTSLPTSGNYHLFASTATSDNGDPKLRVLTNKANRIWDWVSKNNPVTDDSLGTPTDYVVRVKVCDSTAGLEGNCKHYPGTDGTFGIGQDSYKPIGLLQRYGETEEMLFGLISGSYEKNTSGGVLRKQISLISDEIDANTGEFEYLDSSSVKGIIKTIDKLRIKNFNYSNHAYGTFPDAWLVDRAMTEGEFPEWGDPTAEMMYEGLRYFSGAGSATSAYDYSSGDDVDLGLPKVTWDNPYSASDRWCSQPFMLVLSDVNPSYDSDQLPGSAFSTWSEVTLGADSSTLNVESLLDTISTNETISGDYYIGQQGSTYDSSCSPKSLSTLSDVRGLCPEEPTKQGSYYAASVAYFGRKEDINSATSDQNVLTYTVGLASPLPKIEIKLGNPTKTITLVPFGKTVGESCAALDLDIAGGTFQPTNTIVDFYVKTLTDTQGEFSINYEDVEQAADHDQDSIVTYSYRVLSAAGAPVSDPADGAQVRITLTSMSGSACLVMHHGYIISGTTADGTYLEVRDYDATEAEDPDYFLDTPSTVASPYPNNTGWDDDTALPQTVSRTFTPGTGTAATVLTNPLWYAAKWGSFRDHNNNNIPDLNAEWDADGDGNPDNYFYVQNPLYLDRKLNQAFRSILERATSATAASVLSASRSGEGAVYQSIFYPRYKSVTWVSNVHALLVDAYGELREDTNTNQALDATDKVIQFDAFNPGVVRKYEDSNGDGQLTQAEKDAQDNDPDDPVSDDPIEDIQYLWSAADWLNSLTDTEVGQLKAYSSTASARYIFTFIDANNDMLAGGGAAIDSGEVKRFNNNNRDTIKPYMHLFEPFTSPPTGFNENGAADDQIKFIRGIDQTGMRSRKFDSDGNDTLDTTYRLGDIVGSTPTLVGTPAENYDLLYRDESYRKFWLKYKDRRNVVYAGGNDGMLHAFNGGFFYLDSDTASATYGKWKFDTQSEGGSETAYALGAELWAYVPFNLLPHLYWLTNPNYDHIFYVDMKPKIFDAKIFPKDARHPGNDGDQKGWGTVLVCGMGFGGGRIRTDKDHDGNYEPDLAAPNNDQIMKSAYMVFDVTDPEIAPVLLAEISFDGLGFTTSYPGAIVVKNINSGTLNDWYLVLGSGPNGARLKYTTKNRNMVVDEDYPLIGRDSGARAEFVSIDTDGKTVTAKNIVGWFEDGERIFQDLDGDESYDSGVEAYFYLDMPNSVSDLKHGLSSQRAMIYVIDLNSLTASTPALKTLAPAGTWNTTAANAVSFLNTGDTDYNLDDNSQISDFITVDLDLDYATDAMYFGTVAHTASGLGGKLARLVLSDPDTNILPTAPATWDQYSTLFDAGQPLTTAPTIAMDWKKRTWVFFGTGRFTSAEDVADDSQQSFYGIKEPWEDTDSSGRVDINVDIDNDSDLDNEMTWAEVSSGCLLDVSDVMVFETGTIKNYDSVAGTFSAVTDLEGNTLGSFYLLEREMEEDPDPATSPCIYPSGWKLDFPAARERNLGQGALLGDVLTFTTYAPDPNACQEEGLSYLYATFYKTGTAFSTPVIGFGANVDPDADAGETNKKELLRKQSLGKGLAVSPAMHTGKEKGSKAFVQTSTGAILVIEQTNPGAVKSGRAYWMEY